MKKVKEYVMKQENLDENNISDYITMYHDIRSQKQTDETNEV